jgi:very-short-patch-repair endonuclease
MKNKILELYNQGLTNVDIAAKLNCSTNTVWRYLKKVGISRLDKNKNVDWKLVQQLYDSGMSERDLKTKKLVSRSQLDNAKKVGIFTMRSLSDTGKIRSRKYPLVQTEEFKIGQSNRMKQRHSLGLAYTLGHNEKLKKRSYPEQWFETVINNELINKEYIAQFVLGKYCLDFAWPSQKKCVEVDGETHYRFDSEVQKDKIRDAWIAEQGWEIKRFRWKHVISNKETTISQLKEFINDKAG